MVYKIGLESVREGKNILENKEGKKSKHGTKSKLKSVQCREISFFHRSFRT
jgi:hypothetical protein